MGKKGTIKRALYVAKQRHGYQFGGFPSDDYYNQLVQLGADGQSSSGGVPIRPTNSTQTAPQSSSMFQTLNNVPTMKDWASFSPFQNQSSGGVPPFSQHQFYQGVGQPLYPQNPASPTTPDAVQDEASKAMRSPTYYGGAGEGGATQGMAGPGPDIVGDTKNDTPTAAPEDTSSSANTSSGFGGKAGTFGMGILGGVLGTAIGGPLGGLIGGYAGKSLGKSMFADPEEDDEDEDDDEADDDEADAPAENANETMGPLSDDMQSSLDSFSSFSDSDDGDDGGDDGGDSGDDGGGDDGGGDGGDGGDGGGDGGGGDGGGGGGEGEKRGGRIYRKTTYKTGNRPIVEHALMLTSKKAASRRGRPD